MTDDLDDIEPDTDFGTDETPEVSLCVVADAGMVDVTVRGGDDDALAQVRESAREEFAECVEKLHDMADSDERVGVE